MEVLVGSTFGLGMVRDRSGVEAQDKSLFLTEESSDGGSRIGLRRCGRSPQEESSSSSVGLSGESNDDKEEEDDAVSSRGGSWLGSFSSSLEDSLPIKRGLSNRYVGKSKSFGNLLEASNAKDLEKVESLLNKRRLLIANKLRRKSISFSSSTLYSKINPNKSRPLLALQESDQEDHKHNNDIDNVNDDDDSSDDDSIKLQEKRRKMTNNRDLMVQTQSCFCLTSLPDDHFHFQ